VADGRRNWLDEGRRRHREGDFEAALRAYDRCLRARPGQPDVCLLAAMAATQSGRLPEAERYARLAFENRPDARSGMALGQVLLESGEYEEAAACFERATGDPAVATDAHYRRGQALRRLGRRRQAVAALEAAVLGAEEHAAAWNELGVARLELGEPRLAVEAFRRSLAARPGHAAVLANLASAAFRIGDMETAGEAVHAALDVDPGQVTALSMLGMLERARGRLEAAREAFERCVAVDPRSEVAWTGLAGVRQAAGDLEGAGEAYDRALALAPRYPDAVVGKAEWLEWQGLYQDGLDLLREASPDSAGAELVAGRLLRRIGRPGEARRRLEAAVPAGDLDGPLRRQFCFSLGDVCDAEGDFRAAWDWYAEGNRLTPATYDPLANAERLCRFNRVAGRDVDPGQGTGIVFVVGMPRSGTTLAEQILARHPRVHAAGELPHIGRLAEEILAASTRGGGIDDTDWGDVGRRYVESLPVIPGDGRAVTDKMPLNFRYLGVIRAALPGARVVHCRRDPRDTALSCFFTDFIDPALGFATRLDWLADYIGAYLRHAATWTPRFGNRIFDLEYASLVGEPQRVIGSLLEFLDLPWDDACLDFHEGDRIAATASHAQVRKPLYRTSLGRWKLYARQLEPLLDRLAATADGG
jgi:tetratricopeptide (TPR) repeat protein